MCDVVSRFLLKAMVFNTKQPAGLPEEAQGAVLSSTRWQSYFCFTITLVAFEGSSQLPSVVAIDQH